VILIQTSPTSSRLYCYGFTRNTRAKTSQEFGQGFIQRAPSPSEETGEEGNSEGYESKGSCGIEQAARLGPVSANRKLREQCDSFDNRGDLNSFFPSPDDIARQSDSSGRVRYRSHMARLWQIGWDALEIRPERETVQIKGHGEHKANTPITPRNVVLRSGDGRDAALCGAGRC
jgi:hypothetical protein